MPIQMIDASPSHVGVISIDIALNPASIGPVTVYPGILPRKALLHKNGYSHCRVYADQVDGQNRPSKAHASWMLSGFHSNVVCNMQPQTDRGAVHLYSVWRDRRLGDVEARLRIYIPTYVEGICRSLSAMHALTMLRAYVTDPGTRVPIVDFDKAMGCDSFAQKFTTLTEETDHVLVLAALMKNCLHKAMHEAAAQSNIEPLLSHELPPDISPFSPVEEIPNLAGGAVVLYRENFLGLMANRYLELFMPGGMANIPWRRGTIIRSDHGCNRECKEGHDTAHFGDAGTSYKYAGRDHSPLGWDADASGALRELLGIVRFVTRKPINFCLMNFYELRDSIGAHSDDEADLIPDVGVFSISLGYLRLFEMQSRSEAVRGAPVAIRLQHGSALWMAGRTQKTHKHWIDAEKGKPISGVSVLVRVNLTFRAVRANADHESRSTSTRYF